MSKFYFLKTQLVVLLFLFISSNLLAQVKTIVFKDVSGKEGINVLNQSAKNLSIEFKVKKYFVETKDLKGESAEKITLNGVLLPNTSGAPDLPVYSRYIAVPQGATVKLNFEVQGQIIEKNRNIIPAPVIPKEDDDSPLIYTKNEKIYSTNSFYPENSVIISKPMKIRGVDVRKLRLHRTAEIFQRQPG